MSNRDATLLVLVLAALAVREDKQRQDSLITRAATRATEKVVDVVDPDVILERVDVNAIIDRVDVDAVLERVDINAVLDRVDIERLMERIDIDAIIQEVDVRQIAIDAGIPEIVRDSTGELAGSALDVFRRQLVGLDKIVARTTYRVTGRDPDTRPLSPPNLATTETVGRKGRGLVTGHYAGPMARLAAFLLDAFFIWAAFVLTAAGIEFLVELFLSRDIGSTDPGLGIWGGALLLMWAFVYFWFSFTLAGRTLGMGLIGLRVVTRDGDPITSRQALVRTLVFPFSFLILFLGFLGLFTSPERRSMHDAAAGSVVVIDWGDRAAEIPAPLTRWVATREADDANEDEAASPPAATE